MKTLVRVFVLACIAAAFALGWWPERSRRAALEQTLTQTEAQLAKTQSEVQLYRLQDQLLSLLDQIQAGDFAGAQRASSALPSGSQAYHRARPAVSPSRPEPWC